LGSSRSAFADHPPSTRKGGQQNENPKPERGEERYPNGKLIKEEAEKFFENTQATISKYDPTQGLNDLRLLKIKEVAAILGCSVKDAYTLSYECGLPTRKLRGRVRVLGSDLKKWLESLPTTRRSPA